MNNSLKIHKKIINFFAIAICLVFIIGGLGNSVFGQALPSDDPIIRNQQQNNSIFSPNPSPNAINQFIDVNTGASPAAPTPQACMAYTDPTPDDTNFQLVHRCTGGPLITNVGGRWVCECTFSDVLAQIYLIVTFILWLATFYAIGVVAYAGFLYMTSQGNDSKVSHAKELFLNIVIGMIWIVLAYFIVTFILDALGVVKEYRGVGPA